MQDIGFSVLVLPCKPVFRTWRVRCNYCLQGLCVFKSPFHGSNAMGNAIRAFLVALGIIAVAPCVLADSNADIGQWSNAGIAGDPFLVVRSGAADSPDQNGLADYKICVDPGSKQLPTRVTAGAQSFSLQPGECSPCLATPHSIILQDDQTTSNGTFEAFRPGKSCRANASIGTKLLKTSQAKCVPIRSGMPPVGSGHFSAIKCVVELPRQTTAGNYRLCLKGLDRPGKDGYDLGWSRLIVDPSLADKQIDVGGFAQIQFSQTGSSCADIQATQHLIYVIGPYPPDATWNPFEVTMARFQLFKLEIK